MSSTIFTGPVLAGNILNTNGTTPAKAGGSVGLQNVGFTQMCQAAAITQSTTAAATTVVIPANSIITNITLNITAPWSASGTLTIGTSATANELATTIPNASLAAGQYVVTGSTVVTSTQIPNWNNVSSTQDVQVYVKSGTASGTGAAVLIVEYIQGWNGFTKGTTNTNYTA